MMTEMTAVEQWLRSSDDCDSGFPRTSIAK